MESAVQDRTGFDDAFMHFFAGRRRMQQHKDRAATFYNSADRG